MVPFRSHLFFSQSPSPTYVGINHEISACRNTKRIRGRAEILTQRQGREAAGSLRELGTCCIVEAKLHMRWRRCSCIRGRRISALRAWEQSSRGEAGGPILLCYVRYATQSGGNAVLVDSASEGGGRSICQLRSHNDSDMLS